MQFNPLIFSGFTSGGSSSGAAYVGFKPTVATSTDLPLVGNTAGDVRTTADSGQVWVWDNVATRWVDSGLTTTVSFGSTPNSVGYSLTLNNVGLNRIERHLELQPADATNPGLVSTTTQTFGGAKTFNSSVTVVGATTLATSLTGPLKASSGVVSASAIVNADVDASAAIARSKLASGTASHVVINDGGGVLSSEAVLSLSRGGTGSSATPTNGQLLIGNGTNYSLATISGTSNQVSVSNGSGTITLSTPQDIATSSSPTFAGLTLTAFSGFVKATAGVLSASSISLTSDVSGVLPIANGGTNSSTALNNSRFIVSSGGSLVEHSAVTASRALASDGSGLPVAATTTAAELDYLSGVTSSVQTQINSKISSTEKGANNGVATLDAGGKIPSSQLPSSVMDYKGNWDASTNTPTLIDGTGSAGDVYRVNVAGTQDLGSGSITFAIGDWVVYNGTIWEKSLNTNSVTSVNGQTGTVVLSTTNISEGANLYFTDERAQDAVGGAFTNTTTISLTYNDAGNAISADVNSLSLTNSEISASAAIARSKLASGTASHVLINDGSGVMSSEATLSLSRGGTGLASAPSNGQLLIGNGTTYTLATITGTSNQVSVSNGAGSITLSTPQDIHSAASPTFAGLTLSAFSGTVKAVAGVLSASSIVNADIDAAAAIARSKIASGSLNHVVINDGSGNLSSEATLAVSRGGTSLSATPTNGQLLIGNGTNYSLATISGTADQVLVSNGAGTITLSTPQNIAATSSPTFAGLTLTAFSGLVKASAGVLSASALVNADVDTSAAIARSKLASGTANHVLINDGSGVMSSEATLSLSRGGTGVSSAPSNGQILIGNGTGYTVASVTGTSNQVSVTNGAGSITLSIPQDIHSGASPTFAGLTLSGFSGFVKATAGVLSTSSISLTADVSGVLPIANGGTNSSTALNNNRVMISSGGSLVEHSAITANRALASNASGLPVATSVTDTELGYVSGVTSSIQTQINGKISSTEKGAANGVATLDSGSKIPAAQLPDTVMDYRGNWNASTNTPTLADGSGSIGDIYNTSVAGTQDLGSGSITFSVGDWVIYNGSIWEKVTNSSLVTSVNGQTGAVVLTTTNISEGTNLYFTDERAQDAVGGALTNTTTISLTYNDAGNAISADVNSLSLTNSEISASAAIARSKLASGTASHVLINDGSGVMSSEATLSLSRGGTGLASTPTNGQLLIGNGTNYTLATLTGTTNQVSITNGSGTITLSTPQDIATASSPTFAGLTLTAFSGIVKATAGVLSASALNLTTDVTGVLPIANGGTNSSTALNNNRFIVSSGGALVEQAAVTASRALASDTNGLPVASATTATELGYVSGVTSSIQTQLGNKIDSSEKGAANGVATLDAGGRIPAAQLPTSVMDYKGNWDASTNSPTLADGTGSAGDVYNTSVAGTQNLGSGAITFDVGDWVIYNGTIWEKSSNSNSVTSVNGQTGSVVLTTTNISEGTNLYFTDERAQDAVGGALTNTTTISLTYNDAGNAISADVNATSLTDSQISTSAAIARSKLASGTADHVLINNGSGVMSSEATLSLSRGGTGLGSTPSNGQLLIGNGTNYTLATITGTSNQVSVSNGAGTITLSTPQNIDSGASPTFAGLTLTAFSGTVKAVAGVLSAATIVNADIDAAAAISRSKLASGTANHVVINDGSGVMTSEATLSLSRGGTGLSSTPTNGQLLIGNGTSYALSTLTGTANQVSISNGAGTITLSTPQDIATASSPTFAGLTLTAFSGVVKASAGVLSASTIVNADVNAAAAIAYSKLNLTSSIVNADVSASAAIAYSKLNLASSIVNADVASGAAIAVNKLAALTANKAVASDASGFLTASVTSDTELGYVAGVTSSIQTQLNSKAADSAVIKKDGSVTYTANQPLGGFKLTGLGAASANGDAVRYEQAVLTDGSHPITGDQSFSGTAKITNLVDPTSAQDAATKAYVDNAVAGLSWKQAVVAASVADVNVSSAPSTLDGYTLVINDRILLKDQATAAENGIYIFNGATSALTRSSDANTWNEIVAAVVYVETGTTNVGTKWVNTNLTGGTLGTTAISFTTFSAASAISGSGTSGYNAYWTAAATLAAEQYVAASRGGLGTNASAFTGVVKASSGSFSASSLVNADVDAAAAIARSKLASGTASHVIINDGSGVLSSEATLAISRGGTNLSSTPTNGQLLVGNGSGYTLATITGTTDQINVTNGAGTITLSTPQSIASTSSPTFAGLTLTGFSGFVKATGGTLSTATIVNADVDASAAIARSKLASGTASHVLINDGSGVMSSEASLAVSRGGTGLTATPTNGQLLIGNGSGYTQATLTAGSGISVSNGAGTVTISAGSTGDIAETSFTAADNQASAANVTGFAFANGTVRSFKALVSIVRDTTYAQYTVEGIQKAASWEMSQSFLGDDTGLTFTITSAGQIQYTSTNTGSSATVKFRAITTTV